MTYTGSGCVRNDTANRTLAGRQPLATSQAATAAKNACASRGGADDVEVERSAIRAADAGGDVAGSGHVVASVQKKISVLKIRGEFFSCRVGFWVIKLLVEVSKKNSMGTLGVGCQTALTLAGEPLEIWWVNQRSTFASATCDVPAVLVMVECAPRPRSRMPADDKSSRSSADQRSTGTSVCRGNKSTT